MNDRVLFVDDEVSVLNGIKRRFGNQYTVATAASGEEALKVVQSQGPFAVVVTDMRMPNMDGLQFIQAARPKSPDTIFIMLTGNQDQATVTRALNEGSIFRFLTKPCDGPSMVAAVEAGLHQYQLITSEKELLQRTFVGAVSVLTDILELVQPGTFGRAQRVQDIVASLQERLRMPSHWECSLATRLALVGFALLPERDRTEFETGNCYGPQLHELISAAAAVGHRVIERIPRLDNVAKIVGMIAAVDGNMLLSRTMSELDRIRSFATLLRIAIEWDYLVHQGLSREDALDELRLSLPNLHMTVATVLSELVSDVEASATIDCKPADLVEGMMLDVDVLTSDGLFLIRKGRRLTWTIIEKLRSYEQSDVELRPIRVKLVGAAAHSNAGAVCDTSNLAMAQLA